MTWIKSIGTLAYGPGTERLVLLADQEISDLYHSLVPAYVGLARQAYPAHVSVVRRVTPPNMEAWGKHEGKKLPFEYEDRVEHDETYGCCLKKAQQLQRWDELRPYPKK